MISNGLFKITEHRGYATIRCAPAYNDVFLGTRAYYDPDEKAWVVSTRRLDELITYLEDHNHEVIADRLHTADPRICPHGILWGARLEDGISTGGCNRCEALDPEQDATNTRGAAATRAALHHTTQEE